MTEAADINTGLLPGFKFESPDNTPAPAQTPAPAVDQPSSNTPAEKIELKPIEATAQTPIIENATAPAVSPVINEEEIITKILGTGHSYKSFSELEALKIGERLSELQRVTEEHVKVKADIEKYKGKASLMETPQFLSATKYSHFVKEAGMDVDYGTFKKLESGNVKDMNSMDAVILLDYIKNGETGRTREEILNQYHLGDYAPEVEDTETGTKVKKENEFDKRNLEREALGAKKELSQLQEKITGYKPEFQDTTAERETRQAEWKTANAPKKMAEFFKAINPPISEIKGIKVEAAYQFTPQDQQDIEKEIQREIEARDLPLTQESVNTVYGSVMATMLVRKDKERFEVFADKLWSAIDMSLKARYSNYQGLDAPPTRMAPVEKQARTDGTMTISEAAEKMLANANRLR